MNPSYNRRLNWPGRYSPFLVLALTLFIYRGAAAQEVYDLSRCIQNGLERNLNLQVVRNREEMARNNYTAGNAGMLPVVSSSNRYSGTVNSTLQNPREGDEPVTYNGIHNTSGSAGITAGMDLFRGFQVRYTYQKLGELSTLERLRTRFSIEELVSRIVSEYNYYVEQLILYDNLAYAVSLSRERVRIDEQRYLLGSASKMQLLQSIVYLNADSSRYARQNEVIRSSQIRLNELMSVEDLGQEFHLADTLIVIDENLHFDELLALTLDQNTSLMMAMKDQDISRLDHKIIRSRAYPYLAASSGYGYSYNGYGSGTLNNQHVHGMNYGITMGVDLFDGFNRKRERFNALMEIENSKLQYQEVEQEVKADLLNTYFAYENNLRLLRLEEQNLEVARENLEIALEQYKLGSLAGLELREVQKSLLDAEERLIFVKFQTKLAEISLLRISGQIMNYM
jgi:outer membrane protein, adhesin transport system